MTLSPLKLDCIAREFADAATMGAIVKTAIIKRLEDGQWAVMSEKGKPLGKYKTKREAVKRLRQIEYFKHKKSSHEDSYSSIMRDLNKNEENEKMSIFQQVFKDEFDKEVISGSDEPEKLALDKAIRAIAEPTYDEMLIRTASVLEMGDPKYAGKYLAELIKFLMRRISEGKRQHSIDNLKKKIYYLNEFDIASKRAPASSALGQAITLIKHILIEHNPKYIREVLNSVVRSL